MLTWSSWAHRENDKENLCPYSHHMVIDVHMNSHRCAQSELMLLMSLLDTARERQKEQQLTPQASLTF